MSSIAKLRAVTLDCPDPKQLSGFYHELTGMNVVHSDDNFAGLAAEDGTWIGFQRVEGYQPPRWPEQQVPQQFHLDFAVEDIDKAEDVALRLGATKAEFQPGDGRWVVLLDPAGHPFCLTV